MDSQAETEKKNIVLLGLGYVHLHLLKRLVDQKSLPFEVTLVTEYPDVPLRTMVPDFIAGFCKRQSVLINAKTLIEKSNVKFVSEAAVEIDVKKNKIKLKNGEFVRYDFLSINCAARPNPSSIKGATKFGHLNKPVRQYQQAIMDFCDSLRGRKKVSIVQVGSENGGIESVLSLIRRLKAYGLEPSVDLVEPATRLMANHPKKLSAEMAKIAQANRITIHLEAEVTDVREDSVELSNGTELASDFTSIALPLEAAEWVKNSGLKIHNGLVKVNQHLQASEHNVFAVGEIAADPDRAWPRIYASSEKQAKILFQNLKASVLSTKLKNYKPSSKVVEFISDGDGKAILTRGNLVFARRPMFWNWKVKRDHKFQNLFVVEEKTKAKSQQAPTSGRA